MTDAELVADAVRRNIKARDPGFIRGARQLAIAVLGPHRLGGNRTKQDCLRRSAVHESGHALVACVTPGGSFRAVAIRPKARCYSVRYELPQARIAGDLAGAVAELELLGDVVDEGVSTDLSMAYELTRGDRHRLAVGLARARGIITERRGTLDRLVSAVLAAGELSFGECLAIVEAHP